MERRQFIKGMALMSVSPFMPNIPINTESIEVSALHWNKSNSDILSDIDAAMDMIRTSSSGMPSVMIMSESMSRELGINPNLIPDDVYLDVV